MGDVVSRYWMLRGYVYCPIGWDSFGLPAENAAIARDAHPAEWTYNNIATQRSSFDAMRSRSTGTPSCTPLIPNITSGLSAVSKFYERGLTYRKKSQVNGAPKTKTVLATNRLLTARVNAVAPK